MQDYIKTLLNIPHTFLETADYHLHACFNMNFVTLQAVWMPPAPIQAIIYGIQIARQWGLLNNVKAFHFLMKF